MLITGLTKTSLSFILTDRRTRAVIMLLVQEGRLVLRPLGHPDTIRYSFRTHRRAVISSVGKKFLWEALKTSRGGRSRHLIRQREETLKWSKKRPSLTEEWVMPCDLLSLLCHHKRLDTQWLSLLLLWETHGPQCAELSKIYLLTSMKLHDS